MKVLLNKLFFLVLAFAPISLIGQNITKNTDIVENISMQTDRSIYFSGEDIYFTLEYLINELKLEPILSNTVYVELINCADNKPVIQKKYKISDFGVNGVLNIPKGISTGNYMLRAYTQYQRNFSEYEFEYLFLTILDAENNDQIVGEILKADSILIYPEGEILLNKVKNKIVFKIPTNLLDDQNKYYIIDNNQVIIKELTPNYLGFVSEDMMFNANKDYSIIIKRNDQQIWNQDFPKTLNEGIKTSLSQDSNEIIFKLLKIGKSERNKNKFQLAVYSSKLKEITRENITINDTIYTKQYNSNILESGLNFFILFDQNNNVVKINSIYISGELNKVDINVNNDVFKTREEASFEIASNIEKLGDIENFTIAIVKEGTLITDHPFETSIYLQNHWLLENYLKNDLTLDSEIIKQILIAFDNNIDYKSFKEELSKLKQVEAENLKYIPETRDLSLSGLLRNKDSKKPIAGNNIYLSVLFNNPQLHIYKTREDGEFLFSLNNLYGENDIFLCPEYSNADEDNSYEILINNSYSNEIPYIGQLPICLDSLDKELVEELYVNSQIQNAIINKSKDDQVRNKSNNFNLDDYKATTVLDDYVKLENMEELFTEIVPNVKFSKAKGQYTINVYDEKGFKLSGKPLILVDKVPVFDENMVMNMDINKIEKIEVIYKTYILGSNTIEGVIMISTNTENFGGIKLPKSSTFLEYQTLENEFSKYNPINKDLPESMPDYRATLYWNPKFNLNNLNQKVSFKTSDRTGTYYIIVNGKDLDGNNYFGKKKIVVK